MQVIKGNKGFNIQLSEWGGRLGNNLMQLACAIYIASKNDSVLSYPKHPFIGEKKFDFSTGSLKGNYKSKFWIYSEEDSKSFKEDFEVFDYQEYENEKPKILRELILPLLPYVDLEIKFDLVVHIRGGDIMKHPTHPLYVQSPLCYFEKIFDTEKPESVLLVCEDFTNPIIPYIMNLGYNCTLHQGSVVEDMNILLNCRKMVIGGETTFSRILAQASKKIEKVYIPLYEESIIQSIFKTDRAQTIFVEHKNYIKHGNWKFNDEQKELMVGLESENIII